MVTDTLLASKDAVFCMEDWHLQELQEDYPQAVVALRGLLGSIDEVHMRQMNLMVDREGQAPATVAQEFLAGRRESNTEPFPSESN